VNQRTVSAIEYNNVVNLAAKYVEALRIGVVTKRMLITIFIRIDDTIIIIEKRGCIGGI